MKNLFTTKDIQQSPESGFSLIELVVAVAIFAVVVTTTLVGLMSVVDASNRQQAKNEAVNTLNYAVDDMIRRIRTAYNFACGQDSGVNDCSVADNRFSFTASEVGPDADDNARVVYYLSNGRIFRDITEGGTTETQQLTGPPVLITDLRFKVTGTDTGLDGKQSRVFLIISGEIDEVAGAEPETFSIQTTVTQRLLYPPSD